MKPEYLGWDSNFFNCRVGRLYVKPGEFISAELLDDFDLVYLIIENEITPAQKKYFGDKALFVDEKLTYQKEISTAKKPDNHIFSWPSYKEADSNLLEIGVQSGAFSRFKIDPEIPNEKFIELYENWVINSVNRTIAEEVYCFSDKGQIAGMVTLSIKNEKPDIGILSVQEKFRGKGIATGLINTAEYWAKKIKDYHQIQVVTQASNIIACMFYEKCGFTIEKREYIFHWRKKTKKA